MFLKRWVHCLAGTGTEGTGIMEGALWFSREYPIDCASKASEPAVPDPSSEDQIGKSKERNGSNESNDLRKSVAEYKEMIKEKFERNAATVLQAAKGKEKHKCQGLKSQQSEKSFRQSMS